MYMKHVRLFQIALRNMKSIELRVRGSVEPPNIDISVVSVNWHYGTVNEGVMNLCLKYV